MSEPSPIPVICGPTAGGKSALGVALAIVIRAAGQNAEIVTADAFQVYRRMDIGTAKPTPDEMRGVVHHLIDIVEPTERFTASDWLMRASAVITDCRARGVVPIVVGGTHLYVKLLVEGMFEGPAADEALRAELGAMEPAALRAELVRVDPTSATRLHPNDLRRAIRAIEVFRLTGRPISEHQEQWGAPGSASLGAQPAHVLITLAWPVELINQRINARVRAMVERGLANEVRALWEAKLLGPTAREALGYKQLIAHFEGEYSLDDALERIKIETRRFAKNQRTWLKQLGARPGAVRIDATVGGVDDWAETVLQRLHAGQ